MPLFISEQVISLTHIHPALRFKPSKRARRMVLRLDHKDRAMDLVVPERLGVKRAQAFALRHKDWIAAQIDALPVPVPFVDGAVLPLFGQDCALDIYYDPDLRRTDMILDEAYLSVRTNREDPSGRIERFLKEQVRQRSEILAYEKAALIEKSVSAVQIREMSSRWGSCGPDGRLSFSWRLIFAPYETFDYVVAHEVAHLVHMDHSRAFWTLCEELSLDFKAGKNWLKKHGHTLSRYGQKAVD